MVIYKRTLFYKIIYTPSASTTSASTHSTPTPSTSGVTLYPSDPREVDQTQSQIEKRESTRRNPTYPCGFFYSFCHNTTAIDWDYSTKLVKFESFLFDTHFHPDRVAKSLKLGSFVWERILSLTPDIPEERFGGGIANFIDPEDWCRGPSSFMLSFLKEPWTYHTLGCHPRYVLCFRLGVTSPGCRKGGTI